MIEDIKTFFWFLLKGPKFYSTLFALISTKLKPSKDSDYHTNIATKWCKEKCGSIDDCLLKIGISSSDLSTIGCSTYLDASYNTFCQVKQIVDVKIFVDVKTYFDVKHFFDVNKCVDVKQNLDVKKVTDVIKCCWRQNLFDVKTLFDINKYFDVKQSLWAPK